MYIKASRKWQLWLEILMVIVGTFIMGFGFSVFLEPNEISTGGFSAVAMVVNAWFGKIGIVGVPTSVIYLVLNIGLYFLALKTLGKRFALKALIGILSFSLSMELFSYLNISISYEILVSAIYGGVLMGVGVGLVVRFGGSTGGSDMIACIVKKKSPNFTIGTLMICINALIILLSTITFTDGVRLLPYTIIALVLDMIVTDFVNEGYKQIRAFNIVTTKPNELADAIMNRLARGCTCIQAKGMHSKSDRYELICLASRYQMGLLKNIIKEIDPQAFVYTTKVSEVIGAWHTVEEIQKETENKEPAKPKKDKKNKKGLQSETETSANANIATNDVKQEEQAQNQGAQDTKNAQDDKSVADDK